MDIDINYYCAFCETRCKLIRLHAQLQIAVILEELQVAQLLNKLHINHVTRMFITVSTRICHW
jgi:hypothetical protein